MTIFEDISTCTKCPLYKNMPICPVGPLNNASKLMIIGEAPGIEEADMLEPFVGQCGKFFDKIILKHINLERKDIYFTNIMKCMCRKDNKNRPPTKKEIKTCSEYIFEEIKILNPSVIVTLGKIPTETLLDDKIVLKDVVGKHFTVNYTSAIIAPEYHPSFLMRYGKKKLDAVKKRFKKIKGILDAT